MLSKELLSRGGGVDKGYTHIVTVGERAQNYIYGYISESYSDGIGSISPKGLFASNDIEYLHNQQTQFTTGAEIYNIHVQLTNGYDKKVYLARLDTKQVYLNGVSAANGHPSSWYYKHDKPMLFSPDDIGKDIYIWLATTPPPLDIKHRIKRPSLIRRLHNA